MTEPTATDPFSTHPPAGPGDASAGTTPRTPADPQVTGDRPWARQRSHVRALGATAVVLGLWAALSLAAPLLADPVSDAAHLVRELTGQNTVRAPEPERAE